MSTDPQHIYDAIIIGGGPSGSATALSLAKRGRSVLVLEKTRFPRFHVGESLVPQNMELFAELGLLDEMAKLPQVTKIGAEFTMGNNIDATRIHFDQSMIPARHTTFNVERSVFDQTMLDAAQRAGVEVMQDTPLTKVLQLEDGDVRIEADGQAFRSRYLIDASGQATVLGRHLKTRKNYDAPELQKIAYFAHFENVKREDGLDNGNIQLVMCKEAWFWMIPIDGDRTSIGMVLDARVAKQAKRPTNQMLFWGIERCPAVNHRLRDATYPKQNNSISNYSYTCAPFAGPGYFLVGDAATFLDPVFSSGIYLGMQGGIELARRLDGVLDGRLSPTAARRAHEKLIHQITRPFYKVIRQWYQHNFRELLLNGTGPHEVHRALITVLAGQVYPRLPWRVRWRLKLFDVSGWLQKHVTMVPRREPFSLLDTEPAPGRAEPDQPAQAQPAMANA